MASKAIELLVTLLPVGVLLTCVVLAHRDPDGGRRLLGCDIEGAQRKRDRLEAEDLLQLIEVTTDARHHPTSPE